MTERRQGRGSRDARKRSAYAGRVFPAVSTTAPAGGRLGVVRNPGIFLTPRAVCDTRPALIEGGRGMRLRNIVATVFALAGFLGATATALGDAATAGPPVAPHVFTGDLRTLPPVSVWRAGDPTFRGPLRRQTHASNAARPAHPRQGRRDTLPDAQTAGAGNGR